MMDGSGLAPSEVIEAWQCIGCGRVEAPQPCIGVCEDRKVRFAAAASLEEALARLSEARQEAAALEGVARRFALTRPRRGEWERSYGTFQEQARRALSELSHARAVRPLVAPPGEPPPALTHSPGGAARRRRG